ncbi:hypothetical protein, partial [Mycobacterium avium]|uniref:hypothetical protein n=1 Tax=Mycobacterium avium TaxID=1764 RepID=UPI001F40C907
GLGARAGGVIGCGEVVFGARTQAAELLTRRNELLEHLRDVDSTPAQLDAITRREQCRDRDNSHGIER